MATTGSSSPGAGAAAGNGIGKSRAARRRRTARRLALVLIALLLGGLWLYLRISANPSWWRPPDVSDARVVDLGHGTEMDVIAAVHRIRPQEDPIWQYRLRNENMNAWLAVNLPKWFENREGRPWPVNVSLPLVSAREEGFNIGMRLPEAIGKKIVAVRVQPAIEEDGRIRLNVNRVSLGKVSVPGAAAEALLDLVRDAFRNDAEERDVDRIAAMLLGEETISPIIRLNDGRMVRIEGILLEEESVVFTCRTLREGEINIASREDSSARVEKRHASESVGE